jgi:tetratricopeptide (TPR) repeat protein
VETSHFTGGLEAYYKNNFAGADEKKVREQLERYVKSSYDAKKLESCSVKSASSHDEPFELVVAASGCGLATTEYSYASAILKTGGLVDFLPDELTVSKDAKEAKARKSDLFLSLPYRAEYRFHIVPPAGFVAAPLPKAQDKAMGAARYTSSFALEKDGSVTAVYDFDSGKRRLTPAEVSSTREAIRAFLDGNADVIVFKNSGEALLENGDYLGALREFEGLAKASPNDSGFRVRISRALLKAGFASESLVEAKKAVELDGKSADAHQNLAYTYLYDPYGRMFKAGCDIEASKAEYAAAAALDPDNSENRYNLAILNEYGEDFVRYGKGAKLDEAVSIYRAIKKSAGSEADKDSRANNLPAALFRLGRYDEVLAETGETPSDRGARALRAASLAIRGGSEAAVADAARIEPRVDERREVLHQAGSLLIIARSYPEASALLAASARAAGSQDQASSMEFARMVGRVVKSDAAPNVAEPQGFVESFLAALIDPSRPIDGLSSFMSGDEQKRLADPSILADYEASLSGLRDRFGEVGLPGAVFFDFMRSLGEFVVRSEGPAYVVSWSIPSDESVPSLILFLEKGPRGYDIVAASGDLSDIARASMSLLSAGKEAEARSWFVLLKSLDGSDSRLPNLSGFSFLSGLEPSKASADELKRAAALILCSSSDVEDSKLGSSVIYPFWKASTDEEWKKAKAADLALSLLRAGDAERGLEVSGYLFEKNKTDLRAAEVYGFALELSGRSAEGDEIAKAGIARGGSSVGDWKRLLARRLAGRGSYDEALDILKSLFPSGQAAKGDYNNIAWYSLYTKKGLPSDFVDRYAIVKRLSSGSDAEIHTLVCFLAAQGRLSDARELFERYVNIPAKSDALVCERLAYAFLAEGFGLDDCARRYYDGALKKDVFYPGLSVGALAEYRIKNMR